MERRHHLPNHEIGSLHAQAIQVNKDYETPISFLCSDGGIRGDMNTLCQIEAIQQSTQAHLNLTGSAKKYGHAERKRQATTGAGMICDQSRESSENEEESRTPDDKKGKNR